MQDVGARGVEHRLEDAVQLLSRPSRSEPVERPIVDDLDDRKAVEDPPDRLAVTAGGVVRRREDGDVVAPSLQRFREDGRVDF